MLFISLNPYRPSCHTACYLPWNFSTFLSSFLTLCPRSIACFYHFQACHLSVGMITYESEDSISQCQCPEILGTFWWAYATRETKRGFEHFSHCSASALSDH
ncbi:hypothetical protein DFH94DRAFT_841739 [Russula ochroleuca]|uniref:Uncharacterized protein n=1 Tax=Russula ochroleuca TaxID=152965 RepID=A0A9P5TEV1_9AGAM|nr:hypothetical protein DFH94DRAFT_841739 [Russula ochroleuca]